MGRTGLSDRAPAIRCAITSRRVGAGDEYNPLHPHAPTCIRAHRRRLGFAPGMMRGMAFPETKKPRQDRGFCLDGGEAAGYRKVPTRPRRVLLRDNAAVQTQALHIVPDTDTQVCT